MNQIKLLFLLILTLLISACHPTKAEPKLKFETIMNEYFGKYDPVLKPSMRKTPNEISEILISKNRLTEVQMNDIKKNMEVNGWKKIEDTYNFSFFCLNRNQAMSILYPNKYRNVDKSGDRIGYSDINSWSIVLYYVSFGVSDCT